MLLSSQRNQSIQHDTTNCSGPMECREHYRMSEWEEETLELVQPMMCPRSIATSVSPEKHLTCKSTIIMGSNMSYVKLPDHHQHLGQGNSILANCSQDLPGNSTSNEFTTIVLPVLYLVIFLASLLLNSLAVWIFFHIRNKTSFIFYLKNIVVADLMMTLTFPFKIIQDSRLGPWYFHFFLCRYSTVLFYANMYTTIVFLGLISIDRYLKVVKPFGDSRMYSIRFTKILSACVWVVMAFLALPNVILTNGHATRKNVGDCLKLKSSLGVKWHRAVIYINNGMFVVVLIVLIGCYIEISKYIYKSSKQFTSPSSRKRKHNQSIRVVVAVFFTCFVPYHLCRIPFIFGHLDKLLDESAHKILYYCKEVTLFLSACNVCLDPIIYFFMCRSFSRRMFRKSNMRTRSESIRSLQSVRRSEVRIYHEYVDL
uniref:G protein-coupled receptor 87 n=2 Tax=Podarcis muralis TaxID=64176 RepID=A0A670ITP8_PODMU